MDIFDGKMLDNRLYKQWRCSKNKNHVLGVTELAQIKYSINGKELRHATTRLLLFREAVDLSLERPAEIEVAGNLDGKILSMGWVCSICKHIEIWYPPEILVNALLRHIWQSD